MDAAPPCPLPSSTTPHGPTCGRGRGRRPAWQWGGGRGEHGAAPRHARTRARHTARHSSSRARRRYRAHMPWLSGQPWQAPSSATCPCMLAGSSAGRGIAASSCLWRTRGRWSARYCSREEGGTQRGTAARRRYHTTPRRALQRVTGMARHGTHLQQGALVGKKGHRAGRQLHSVLLVQGNASRRLSRKLRRRPAWGWEGGWGSCNTAAGQVGGA